MKPINFEKLKKDLIKLYEDFLKNPESKLLKEKAIKLEKILGGLSNYNDYFKSQPVPKDIEKGLNGLSAIYQYGMWDDSHEAFSKSKIIGIVRKTLILLKK